MNVRNGGLHPPLKLDTWCHSLPIDKCYLNRMVEESVGNVNAPYVLIMKNNYIISKKYERIR